MIKTDSHRIATIFGFLALACWSCSVALGRSTSEQLGPLTAAAAVYGWAGILSLSFVIFSRKKSIIQKGESKLYLYGCGALFVIYMICFFLALGLADNRQQSLEVGLINYLWPSLILIFSLLLLKKGATGLLPLGLIIASAGVYCALTHQSSVSWEDFSAGFLSNPPAYCFALAAAFAYVLWDIAMRKGDVVLVTSCSYFTPFMATLIACFYLGITPGDKLWYGCALITGGAILCGKSVKEERGRKQ